MKRLLQLSLLAAMLCNGAYAQTNENASTGTGKHSGVSAFKQGSTTGGMCLGFGVNYNDLAGSIKTYPAFGFVFDKSTFEGNWGAIGFGCIAALKYANYDYGGLYNSIDQWDVIAALRVTYHITALKRVNNHFDPYAGIMAGARRSFYGGGEYTGWYTTTRPQDKTSFVRGIFAGAKYDFTRSFGVFAEFGFDISNFRFGLNINTRNK